MTLWVKTYIRTQLSTECLNGGEYYLTTFIEWNQMIPAIVIFIVKIDKI